MLQFLLVALPLPAFKVQFWPQTASVL